MVDENSGSKICANVVEPNDGRGSVAKKCGQIHVVNYFDSHADVRPNALTVSLYLRVDVKPQNAIMSFASNPEETNVETSSTRIVLISSPADMP